MTCQDLHSYFDSDMHVATDLLPDSVELAEHTATCSPCTRFVEEQMALKKDLHLLRDSAPPIPVSLDKALVAKYRSFVLGSRLVKSTPIIRRINLRAALGWAAAIAFAVVVAYGGMLLFVPNQHAWVNQQVSAREAMEPPAQTNENKRAPQPHKFTRKTPRFHADSVKRDSDTVSIAEQETSFPARFQSLMYCDQISCPGAMEVIRVQLPSPVLGLTPTLVRPNGVVSADILVGPDGIARGIRVVE